MHRAAANMTLLALLLLAWVRLADAAPMPPDDIEKARLKALDFEKRSMWAEACRCYEELGRKDRGNTLFRDAYHRCLRRLHLGVRHSDGEYRAALSRLTVPQALDLYGQVLSVLSSAHPDRERASINSLFQHGLDELRNALEDPAFRRSHLPDVKDAALNAFKSRLAAWPLTRVTTRAEARSQAQAISRAAAREGLPTTRPGVMAALILEFAAGACNALDEHSLFVTPGQLGLLQAALRGKLVSTGIELAVKEEKLQVVNVVAGGPAEKDLRKGDLVHKIGGASVVDLPADAAAERLRGEPDTTVEIVVSRAGKLLDPIKVTRRAAPLPSVESRTMQYPEDNSLYVELRINYFAESTLAEVKAALANASASGEPLKGIILDLRGNPGGLFDSAVAVAELFIPEGVIVIGSSPFKKYNRTYKAEAVGPYQMPLVVLIDSDTASAAEVLAGAIKDTRGPTRGALVVGQTSYGKGSIQCLIPLEKAALDKPAALRLTVAKLFSPGNLPYTGRGITPDAPLSTTDPELVMEDARTRLHDLIKSLPMRMMMPPM